MSEAPLAPLDLDAYRRKATAQHQSREDLIADLEGLVEDAAAAEREYRRALAAKMVELRAEYGATMARDLARGDEHVSELKAVSEIKHGLITALRERLELAERDAAVLNRAGEWSQRVDY